MSGHPTMRTKIHHNKLFNELQKKGSNSLIQQPSVQKNLLVVKLYTTDTV